MKKLLLVLGLVFSMCFTAYAEDSYADLVKQYNELRTKIISHKDFKKATVKAGVYEIGKDIPEGKYEFAVEDESYVTVSIYKTMNGSELKDIITFSMLSKKNNTWTVTLAKGNYLEVTNPVIMRKTETSAIVFE